MLNENVVDLLSKKCDTSGKIHKTMIIDTGCPSVNESAINFPIPSVTNQSKRKMTENKFSHLFELMSWLPLSLLSVTGMGVTCLIAAFALPRAISQLILYPGFRLLFGTLYPAYASYKAIRTKNVKEYVKWMMYWIVFAFFSCIETFTDIFLSWFPFYYEVKVIIVLWLLSPATKGSSTLYRKFVHPMLTKREQEIDEYINQAKEKGYSAVLQLGSKGVNYATSMIMQTAIKGGGNLVSTLRNSYSLTDLSDSHLRAHDEIDEAQPQRLMRSRTQSTRSSSIERNYDVYFSELNIASKLKEDAPDYRSIDDISSGYSSAEVVPGALSRTASLTNASKSRIRAKKAEDLTDNYRYVAADMNTDLATLLEDYPFLLNYLKVPEHSNQFSYSNFEISQQKDTDVFAKDNFKREELLDTRTEAFETNIIEPTIVKEDSCDDEFQDAENVVEEILSSTALIDNENHSDVPSPSDKLDTTSFPSSSLNVVDEVSIADSKLNTFTIPEIISDTVVGSILNDNSKVETFKSESMEEIVDSQLSASKLDLTEAPYKRYSKRKAPLPPPINMIESQDETVITSQQLESIKKTDEKEKKKKHLLNYIPSIFRPISPANSSKSIHMETDI